MAKCVYINNILDLLASAVVLCSVVLFEEGQMRRSDHSMASSRHARPPPQQLGEDIARTM
jgi:hypothetical protein